MVAVVSNKGIPLMPTSEYRARRLLKKGRAVIFKYRPFTIQIADRKDGVTQPVEYKCDTGYQHIGISICSEKREFVNEQRDMLPDEVERHTKCRKYRRTRRNRKRYRKARFNNLSDTKKYIRETGNTISNSLKETQTNVRADIRDVQTDIRDVQTDIKDVQIDIRDVQSDVETVQTSINDIEKMLIEEKTASQYRYDNMQDKQQMLHSSLQNLQDMYRELQRVLLENDRLQEENIQLKENIEQLKTYVLSKQPKENDRFDDEFER